MAVTIEDQSMGWASIYIARLRAGETVSFRPRGNSMTKPGTPAHQMPGRQVENAVRTEHRGSGHAAADVVDATDEYSADDAGPLMTHASALIGGARHPIQRNRGQPADFAQSLQHSFAFDVWPSGRGCYRDRRDKSA
jgi:hypothetical protein